MIMRLLRKLLFAVLLTGLFPAAVTAQSVIELIERDRQAGAISRTEQAILIGYSAVAPERLPPKYQNAGFIDHKCGFGKYQIVREEYNNFSPELQELFKVLVTRPSMTNSYVSPSGNFRIHYEVTGTNQVPSDDDNSNGIPDYVEEAGEAFDHSRRILVDTLGFQAPPPDEGVDGSEYDVYVLNMNNYGSTSWYPMPGSDTRQISYIEIENDYAEDRFSTHGIEGVKVTAAHEYFHAVHVGYIWSSLDIFFYEWSSTWFEDVAYSGIDDYLQYLTTLFKNLTRPVNTRNGWHEYGMCIWHHFMSRRYGRDIVRKMWERMPDERALAAIENTIVAETGSTFEIELTAFYQWNYFTGTRADTENKYPEGDLYPEVVFGDTINAENDTTITVDVRYLSGNYVAVNRQMATTYNVDYSIDPGDVGDIHGSAFLNEGGVYSFLTPFGFTSDVTGEFSISSSRTNSQFMLIPVVSATMSRPGTTTYPITFNFNFLGPAPPDVDILMPTWPNPADFTRVQEITIPFVLREEDYVEIKIFSTSGRLVKSFEKALYYKGLNSTLKWDGNDNNNRPVPSGVYFYVINSPSLKDMKKMAIIR
ncbi:MXAN_6640 family putative metalloprotease [candidate division KSB1 bacterium]